MVKLPLQHGNGGNVNETSLLHKMAMTYPFKDDNNIFKNIHSFLRPKNKEDYTHYETRDSEDTKHAENSEQTPGGRELKTKQFRDESMHSCLEKIAAEPNVNGMSSIQDNEQCSKSTASSYKETSDCSITGSADTVESSNIFTTHDKPRLFFSHSYTPSQHLSNESMSPLGSQFQNNDDLLYFPTLPNQSRTLRSNSYNNVSGNGFKTLKGNNLSGLKRGRRSIKKSRESSRKNHTTDPSQQLTLSQQISCNSLFPLHRAHKSLLSESQIPFYHDENNTSDQFPRITVDTLRRIVEDGIHKLHYESYYIIDCRFDYEFKGGHVIDALNISSREELEQAFIQKERSLPSLLIFHCEFSSYRGPLMASHLRNRDRILNYDNYPDLYYPDILILDGGYKKFFDHFPNLCWPRRYVGMDSSENLLSRDQEMERFRHDSKRMVSRNSSLHKLASVPSSSKSSFKRASSTQDLIHNSKPLELPDFKYEAPPRLSLGKYTQNNISGSSDDCSSLSKVSIGSSPNLSTNKMLLMDGLDNDSCYSFEEGDCTFTTPIEMLNTPTFNQTNRNDDNSPLNPVKRLLFSEELLEEETEMSE